MLEREQQVCFSLYIFRPITVFELGESDYTIEDFQLTFTVGSDMRACTTVDATDDSALENSEELTLFLSTDVIHSQQPINITISDNDSVLLSNVVFNEN